MLADPTLLQQPQPDPPRFDRQAYWNAARRGASFTEVSGQQEGTEWAEYAAFVLEQEAEYCQQ